ncbi:hypothetical protein CHUAL_008077 [Chamberlinius hualienensis]
MNQQMSTADFVDRNIRGAWHQLDIFSFEDHFVWSSWKEVTPSEDQTPVGSSHLARQLTITSIDKSVWFVKFYGSGDFLQNKFKAKQFPILIRNRI